MGEKSKVSTFPVVMPLWGEKVLYAYIHTWKLIIRTVTQFLLICVLTQHPNNNSVQFILRANLTTQRPITKRARVEKKEHTYTNKIQKQGNFTTTTNNN
jgi:hypothetical protein